MTQACETVDEKKTEGGGGGRDPMNIPYAKFFFFSAAEAGMHIVHLCINFRDIIILNVVSCFLNSLAFHSEPNSILGKENTDKTTQQAFW